MESEGSGEVGCSWSSLKKAPVLSTLGSRDSMAEPRKLGGARGSEGAQAAAVCLCIPYPRSRGSTFTCRLCCARAVPLSHSGHLRAWQSLVSSCEIQDLTVGIGTEKAQGCRDRKEKGHDVFSQDSNALSWPPFLYAHRDASCSELQAS